MGSVLTEALVTLVVASAVGVAAGFASPKGLVSVMAAGRDRPAAGADDALAVGGRRGAGGRRRIDRGCGAVPARRAMRIAPVEAMRQAVSVRKPEARSARAIRSLASVLGRPAERFGGSAGMLARRNAMRNSRADGASAAALAVGSGARRRDRGDRPRPPLLQRRSLEQGSAPTTCSRRATGSRRSTRAAASAVAHADGVSGVAELTQDQGRAFGSDVGVNGIEPGGDRRTSCISTGRTSRRMSNWPTTRRSSAPASPMSTGSRSAAASTSAPPMGARRRSEVAGIQKPPKIDPFTMGEVTVTDRAFAADFPRGLDRLVLVSASGGRRSDHR